MRKTWSWPLLAGALLLGACGKEDEDDEQNAVNLDGTWTSGECKTMNETRDGQPVVVYLKDTATFNTATTALTFQVAEFTDAACALPANTFEFNGTYKTGAGTAGDPTAVEGATNIDITVGTLHQTLFLDADLAQANSTSYCGGGWTKGTRKEVSVAACGANAGIPFDKGATLHEIFKATATELFFGDGSEDGTKPENRPKKLDPVPMKKV